MADVLDKGDVIYKEQYMTIEEKEKLELEYWANNPEDNPNVFGLYGVLNKMYETKIFIDKVSAYNEYFSNADVILELGAGQGWASCIIKSLFSNSVVYTSDLSSDAIKSLPKWERIFNTCIDKSFACRSNELPLEDNSIDLVFCFQSAHHFTEHEKTIKEINRVLKKGGVCLYLREPVCRKHVYPLAYKKANKIRPSVPEDVLIYKDIIEMSQRNGFVANYIFDTLYVSKYSLADIYSFFIYKSKLFRFLFSIVRPFSSDFIFTKNSDL